MAIGKASDFVIYDEQVHGGFIETLVQNTDAFNAASNGTIRFSTNRKKGDYDYEAFIQNIAGIVGRRDATSTATKADKAVAMAEMISVKLNRGIGPIAQTLDAFRKVGAQANVNSLSFLIGSQIAKAMSQEWLDTSLSALVASIGAQGTLTESITTGTTGTITTTSLVDALAKRGDAAGDVVLWVMHSKAYYDLVKEQIGANITNISNFNIATASPVTLNRPVLVTDSAALLDTGVYSTLGLVQGAAVIEDSEEEIMHAELVTGLENLVVRLQGEYAYNLGIKGTKWDVAAGGANPNAAAVATGSNWDKVVGDVKNMGGVVLKTD